jgi:hypothetical protein
MSRRQVLCSFDERLQHMTTPWIVINGKARSGKTMMAWNRAPFWRAPR